MMMNRPSPVTPPRASSCRRAKLAEFIAHAKAAAESTYGQRGYPKGQFNLGSGVSETMAPEPAPDQDRVEEGATLVTGGPAGTKASTRAYYVKPSVVRKCDQRHDIAREESFGPVLVDPELRHWRIRQSSNRQHTRIRAWPAYSFRLGPVRMPARGAVAV